LAEINLSFKKKALPKKHYTLTKIRSPVEKDEYEEEEDGKR